MKYYSEKLNKFFDNDEACLKAEEAFDKKKADEELRQKKLKEERAARAKEVEEAYKAIVDAKTKYAELKNKFIADYGSFHQTFNFKTDIPTGNWNDLFNLILDL
jgi:hypothetical protein